MTRTIGFTVAAVLVLAGSAVAQPADPITLRTIAQLVDQTCFFRLGNELAGEQQPVIGVLPADQGFKPDYAPGIQLHLGLVVQNQLIFCDGARQAAFYL